MTLLAETKNELSFEEAFARLEHILELMNGDSVSLDRAVELYEEADQLITACNKRLNDAEKRVQMLIKNRNGELALGTDQKPLCQPFQ